MAALLIIANVAAVYNEAARASHRYGYFENAVLSLLALAALLAGSMCLPNTI